MTMIALTAPHRNHWKNIERAFSEFLDYSKKMLKKVLQWCLDNPDKVMALAVISVRLLDGDWTAVFDLQSFFV